MVISRLRPGKAAGALLTLFFITLSLFGAAARAPTQARASGLDVPTPTVGYPQISELYKPPISTQGVFPGLSNPTLFGPAICPSYGDPNIPGYDDYITMGGKYTYRIAIPSDYASSQLNVELFDPDTGNSATTPTTIYRTTGTSAAASTCTTPYAGTQKEPCMLSTGETNNPWWTVKVDENRGDGAGACINPASYTASLNTRTLYRLYYYDTNGNQVDLAYYVGKSDYASQPVLPSSGYTAAQAAAEGVATDLKWVSPGAAPSDRLPAFAAGALVNGVSTVYGSSAEPATLVENCNTARTMTLSNASGVFPVSGAAQCQGDGNFIISLATEVPGLGTDANNARNLYLDVRSLSGSSENNYDIWAGPPSSMLPSDVNARNLMIYRQLADNNVNPGDTGGVSIYAENNQALNSDATAAASVPLTYLGPELAGQSISPTVFDIDAGSAPPIVFYLDGVPKTTWAACFADSAADCATAGATTGSYRGPANLPDSGVWTTYTFQIPATINGVPFAGGNLMVYFLVGATDTYVWKVAQGAPLPPTLLAPAAGASSLGTPQYSWSASPSAWANRYVFQYDDNADFSSPIYTSGELTALNFTPPAQVPGTYYWRVKAGYMPANKWSFWSNPHSVIIQPTTPTAPILSAPADGGATQDTTPDFSWDSAWLADTYTIQIDNNSDFSSPEPDVSTGSSLTYTAPPLLPGLYFWRVRGVNTEGAGEWSLVRTLGIYDSAPPTPGGLHAASQTISSITMAWDDTFSETGFRLERSDDGITNWAPVASISANTLSMADSGLTCSTQYYYRIQSYNLSGDSAFSDPVAASTVVCAPAAPSNLSVSTISQGETSLTWEDNSTTETGFRIERSVAGANTWTLLTTTAADATSFGDTGLTCGTSYDYRVRSTNAGGDSSNATATGATAACNPDEPTNLTASVPSQVQINLSWMDNSSDETGFRIERSPAGMATWTTVANVGANTTSYANSGLACGTSYDYRVTAFNGSGVTAASNTASATTLSCTPNAPSLLYPTAISATRIDLSWHDNSNNETGFQIEWYGPSNSGWMTLATVGPNVTTYSHTGLTCNSTYNYRVKAISSGVDSAYAATATQTTLACPPAAPSALTAVPSTPTQVNLAWTDNATNETGFKVQRSPAGQETWVQLGTTGVNIKTFSDANAACGTAYDYRVYAYNAGGDSSMVTASGIITPDCPAPPSNATATTLTISTISVSWVDNSTTETGFRIERSLAGANSWVLVATPGANTTSFTITGLACGTAYDFRVKAAGGLSSLGYSAPSNVATAATIGCPPASPSSLALTNITQTHMDVSWLDNSNNETAFLVQRSLSTPLSLVTIATLPPDTTTYSDDSLDCSKSYTYQIVAVGAESNSSTGTKTAATIACNAAAPTNLVATVVGQTQINLTWTDNSIYESGFKLERSLAGADTWTQVAALAANATSYNNTSLPCGTSYDYRIYAWNTAGNSAYATVNAATPLCLPNAPTGLGYTKVGQTQIMLTWTDNATTEANYIVLRSDGNQVTYATIATLPANSTSYTDTAATCGALWNYRVYATNSSGNSNPVALAGATSSACSPGAPTLTSVTATPSQVTVVWADNSTDETGFKIERYQSGVYVWGEIGTTSAGSTSYVDTTVACNTNYTYRVHAYGPSGDTSVSSAGAVLMGACPPAAPTNLTASGQTATSLILNWTDNSSNETGFRVEQWSTASNAWVVIANRAANSTTYTNTGLTCGTNYNYRLTAYNGSTLSASITLTAGTLPCTPTGLSATAAPPTQINLSWTDTSSNETGYVIWRTLVGSGTWTNIATTAANATSYQDSGLPCGVSYSYYIYATNAAGNSAQSSTVTVSLVNSCPPAAPTLLSASGLTQGQINITWTDNANNENGFKIERATPGQNDWVLIATSAANLQAYANTGLTCNTSYDYRMYAYNLYGTSSTVGPVTGTTKPCTPVAPSDLTATTTLANQVDLSWMDHSDNETGFKVERSVHGANIWTTITTTAADVASYSDADLPCGVDYDYRVSATNSGGTSAPTSAADGTTPACAPAKPTALLVTPYTQTQINLRWNDSANNETGYKIERSAAGQNDWALITTTGADTNEYLDTGLTCNTGYDYRVYAYNATGNSSATGPVTGTTKACTPVAPSDLTATTTLANQVDLSWTDHSDNETGFKVERSVHGANSWTTITTTAADVASYTDSGLSCGGSYDYRVSATNAGGTSAVTGTANGTTQVCVPSAPSGFSATTISQTQITVAWTDNSNNETGFKIERSPAGANTWALLVTTGANAVTYANTGLTCGASYDYRISALNAGGASAIAGPVTATTVICAPSAPSGLTAMPLSQTRIDLSWTDNSNNETGFKIERSPAGANTWTLLSMVAAGTTGYANTGLSCGQSFDYRVSATNSGGTSTAAGPVSATTVLCVPAAPSSLSATLMSPTQFRLNWTDNANNEAGFRVERSTAGANSWTLLMDVDVNTTSYDDNGVSCGNSYDYRVSSFNSGGYSTPVVSNGAAVTCAPSAPSGLTATPVSQSRIDLSWTDNSNNETGFKIERSPAGANNWSVLTTTGANVTSYANSSLTCDQSFEYRVSAVNAVGSSAATDSADASTLTCALPAPSGLAATAITPGQIDLSWVDNTSDEDNYRIERSPNGVSGWQQIVAAGANSQSYADTSANCNTQYYYRVRGYNSNGFSAYSNLATAQTSACLAALAAPKLVTAQNLITGINTPSIQWLPVTGASGYHVQMAADSKFKTVVQNSTTTGITYDASALSDGVYYWRVATVRYGVEGKWSAPRKLTIDTIAPAPPALKSMTIKNGLPTFTAIKVKDGVQYVFEVSSDFGSSDALVVHIVLSKTAYKMPLSLVQTLTHGETYYWRVAAVDKAGNMSGWSSIWSFSIP